MYICETNFFRLFASRFAWFTLQNALHNYNLFKPVQSEQTIKPYLHDTESQTRWKFDSTF